MAQQKSYQKMPLLLAGRFLYRPLNMCGLFSSLCDYLTLLLYLLNLLKSYMSSRAQLHPTSAIKHSPIKPSEWSISDLLCHVFVIPLTWLLITYCHLLFA